jgi:phenol 2-monooxygenase
VLSSKFRDTEQERIPDYFWPKSGKWGIRGMSPSSSWKTVTLTDILDFHKTYLDDEHYNSGHGHAYKIYGVNPDVGAVVIVRPDQCKQT